MAKKQKPLAEPAKKAEKVQEQKRRRTMKIKPMFAVAALAYAPLAVAGANVDYPREKVAAFIVEKLDLTSLPLAYRPKLEKRKHLRIMDSRRKGWTKTKPSS